MYKKIISLITLIAFLGFSCGTTRQLKRDKVDTLEGKKILGVVKTSGETFLFQEDTPVRIEYDHITGRTWRDSTVAVKYQDVDQISKNGITTKDGESYIWSDYHVVDDKEAGAYLFKGPIDIVSIPFSDVKEVIVFSRSGGSLRGGGTGFLIGAGAGLLLNLATYDPNSEWGAFPVVIGTAIFGVLGFSIGSIAGSAKGTTLTYQMNESNGQIENSN